jgi:hypothetical protein
MATYRLHMEDSFNLEGTPEGDSIYTSSTNDGLAGFRSVLAMAEAEA